MYENDSENELIQRIRTLNLTAFDLWVLDEVWARTWC
ncbi:hypothetical protein PC129_g11032 [Phytophthora cactorum]|uniref:Uncharacterized protein n=1 Tax=Phytophthora cactorum TaxID=29920 RepID=A0A8T1HYV8_9STRA|nr:hypothetical protein PC111_g10597 [Phytophthora cactorum]KAG2902101.1 hypothetical protein PC114_g12863 [Phytophthora cactorum]KAG2942034.1 hypothetical protein PC117_g9960 [Phytophthora cactorum]KAG3015433.1 hypothetical protein PC119_g11759 [Phytophthora cactorum]KAG3019399.1 hypothetical protein PC120_g9876 [Phytophthora cactorum]